MSPDKEKVVVEINGQQYRLIRELREKGTHGQTDAEIIRRGFEEWGKKRRLERSK